jgi:hypothetical protein
MDINNLALEYHEALVKYHNAAAQVRSLRDNYEGYEFGYFYSRDIDEAEKAASEAGLALVKLIRAVGGK